MMALLKGPGHLWEDIGRCVDATYDPALELGQLAVKRRNRVLALVHGIGLGNWGNKNITSSCKRNRARLCDVAMNKL